MIKKIEKGKLIFSLMLFLYLVFMLGSATFADADTVTFYPKDCTIHDYNHINDSTQYATQIRVIDGEGNVGSDNIDEVWYYTIPNYKSEAVNADFTLYGPVTRYYNDDGSLKNYVKNLFVSFTDSIPSKTIRMYFYTVYTADKSYEASEVHSIDITLNRRWNASFGE